MTSESGVRWSTFKVLISILLLIIAFTSIYLIITPIIEGDRSAKDFANIIFGILIIIIMSGIVKVKENRHWVFWACSSGLILFSSMMFIFYESLFS